MKCKNSQMNYRFKTFYVLQYYSKLQHLFDVFKYACAILKPFRVSSLSLFKGHQFKIVSSVDSAVLTGVKKFLGSQQLGTLLPSSKVESPSLFK